MLVFWASSSIAMKIGAFTAVVACALAVRVEALALPVAEAVVNESALYPPYTFDSSNAYVPAPKYVYSSCLAELIYISRSRDFHVTGHS